MDNEHTPYAITFWPTEIDGDLGYAYDPWVILSNNPRDVDPGRIQELFDEFTAICVANNEAPENSPLWGFTTWLQNTHGYEIANVVGSMSLNCDTLYDLESAEEDDDA